MHIGWKSSRGNPGFAGLQDTEVGGMSADLQGACLAFGQSPLQHITEMRGSPSPVPTVVPSVAPASGQTPTPCDLGQVTLAFLCLGFIPKKGLAMYPLLHRLVELRGGNPPACKVVSSR